MWKLIDSPASCATAHRRSQYGSASFGMPQWTGSPVMITPLWPLATHRDSSLAVKSMSQNGRAAIGMRRLGSAEA